MQAKADIKRVDYLKSETGKLTNLIEKFKQRFEDNRIGIYARRFLLVLPNQRLKKVCVLRPGKR